MYRGVYLVFTTRTTNRKHLIMQLLPAEVLWNSALIVVSYLGAVSIIY